MCSWDSCYLWWLSWIFQLLVGPHSYSEVRRRICSGALCLWAFGGCSSQAVQWHSYYWQSHTLIILEGMPCQLSISLSHAMTVDPDYSSLNNSLASRQFDLWSSLLTYIHMTGPCRQIKIVSELIITTLKLSLMVVTSHREPESPTFQCMVSAYGGGNILKC